MDDPDEWLTIANAAKTLGISKSPIYKWLARPESETKIQRMTIRKVVSVHMPSLVEYEATVRIGRPPTK